MIDGNPGLTKAAVESVKQWVYQPTLLNGAPAEVTTEVDVDVVQHPTEYALTAPRASRLVTAGRSLRPDSRQFGLLVDRAVDFDLARPGIQHRKRARVALIGKLQAVR